MRPVYQGKTEHYALCAQHVTPGPRAVETWKWKVVFRSSAQTVRDVLCWGATTAHVCLHRRTQTNVHTMIMVLYAGQENELAVFERWNQICLHTWRGWMWRTDFFFFFFFFFHHPSDHSVGFCQLRIQESTDVASILKFLCWLNGSTPCRRQARLLHYTDVWSGRADQVVVCGKLYSLSLQVLRVQFCHISSQFFRKGRLIDVFWWSCGCSQRI